VTELDPYAVLGVPRTATREEIARAYRRLAKLHHPDSGAPTSRTMSRINGAWRSLSDPARRARWDREHTVVQPPHWAATPAEPMQRRPAPQPAVPPSRLDSGRITVLVIAGVAVLVGVVLIGLNAVAGPTDFRSEFTDAEISFKYDAGWTVYPGEPELVGGHRVVAQMASFGLTSDELCTSAGQPCLTTGDLMPDGEVAVVITAWSDGAPPEPEPEPEPVTIIGGEPAAVEVTQVADVFVAWWQLSPPGFPDRWIEVRADFRASRDVDGSRIFRALQDLLDSVEFGS